MRCITPFVVDGEVDRDWDRTLAGCKRAGHHTFVRVTQSRVAKASVGGLLGPQ